MASKPEWPQKELGQLVRFRSGGTPSKAEPLYWNGSVPWYTAKDLKRFRLHDSLLHVTEEGVCNGTRIVGPSTILMLVRGMTLLKDVPIGITQSRSTFNQDIRALEVVEGVDVEFLGYALVAQVPRIRQLVSLAGHGTGRLATELVQELPVPIPGIAEQVAVANILSTWDKEKELLDRLITAKQRLKRGLMQQLLTGKRRFPGYERAPVFGVEAIKLAEVASVIVSNVDKKTVEGERSVRLCNYTDVYYNNEITSRISFMNASAKPSEIEKFSILRGDVIVTKDSETPDDIAVPALVTEDLPGVLCGYHLAIIRCDTNRLWPAFLNHLLKDHLVRHYFFTLANGATRFGLSKGSLCNAHLPMPSLPEQKKIAGVLSAIDREIALLNQERDALQKQKRGLMQQLLTGKVRVPVANEPAEVTS